MFGHRNASEGNAEAGALLLADLRRLFADRGAMRLPSNGIVAALEKMEERPTDDAGSVGGGAGAVPGPACRLSAGRRWRPGEELHQGEF